MQTEAAILQNFISSIMANPEEKNETSGIASTSMPGEQEKDRIKFFSTLLSATGGQGLHFSTEGPFPLNSPASEIVEDLESFMAILGQKMPFMNDQERFNEKMHENLAVLKNVDTGDLSAVTNRLFQNVDGNHHLEHDILKVPLHLTESVAAPEKAKNGIPLHLNLDTSFVKDLEKENPDTKGAIKTGSDDLGNVKHLKGEDPEIAVKSRMTEHSNKDSFSQKTEVHQIHGAKVSDSDKGATGESGNSNNKDFRVPIVNPDSSQQSMRNGNSDQKNSVPDLNMGMKQIIKIESGSGEESTLSSNHQSSDKNISSVIQSKDIQHSEKSFQPTIMKQVAEKAILSLKNGQTSIKLSLRPDVLGHLKMHISTENNQVSIRIITEVPMVKDIIESNLAQLRTDFQKQGLELEKFDISVGQGSTQNNGAFERFSFQGKTGGNMDGENDGDILDESREATRHVEKHDASNLIDYFA